MDEDDLDFTPNQNTSSHLASLFVSSLKPPESDASLTYTAPKAPKKELPVPKKPQTEEKNYNAKILCSKAVLAYSFHEDNTSVNQGVAGVVITGNHNSQKYEIILYKPSKEHICKARITKNFVLISPNNYASFYDINMKKWSIMFHSLNDVEEFAEMIAVCKFYCSASEKKSSASIIEQDLTTVIPSKQDLKTTVEVTCKIKFLESREISLFKEQSKEKIKLGDNNYRPLNKVLMNCSENSKKIIVIPRSLCGQWAQGLGSTQDLILIVNIDKIIVGREEPLPNSKTIDDGAESPVDSSTEETSIKARGASIKMALSSTKTQKANLISRMARMGQATLPLKRDLTGGQSDSEEEITTVSSPKPRMSRNKVCNIHQSASASQTGQSQNPEVKQLSVYQNDSVWQQSQLGKPGVMYQQLLPLSASPVSSPTTDPNLSIYITESRVQAAELRMGLSRVSEKVDLVLNKVQDLSIPKPENKVQALMDPSGVISSIQNLIVENDTLKKKVEEQKDKIEQQNDRLFQLLEFNHKYLDQNSSSPKQSEHELKLKSEIECLQKKEIEMEADQKKNSEKMKILEEDLVNTKKTNKELNEAVEKLNRELEDIKKNSEANHKEKKKELEILEEKLSKALDTNKKYKEKLKEVALENEKLESFMTVQKEEIEAGKMEKKNWETKKREHEMVVKSLTNNISVVESRVDIMIQDHLKTIEDLKKEKESLIEKIKTVKMEKEEEIKTKIYSFYMHLKNHFSHQDNYSSSDFSIVNDLFNKAFGEYFQMDFKEESKNSKGDSCTILESSKEPGSVPSNTDSGEIKTNDNKVADKGEEAEKVGNKNQSEAKKKDETAKEVEEEETDARHESSYFQGWRPTEPPPLFEDDDEEYEYY